MAETKQTKAAKNKSGITPFSVTKVEWVGDLLHNLDLIPHAVHHILLDNHVFSHGLHRI